MGESCDNETCSSAFLGDQMIKLFALLIYKKEKKKVQVYSLVSSTKCYSPDFTQLPPGHRTCSFISHLNSPGSIQPGCHFRRMELFKHTSLHCPTRYPLTPGSRECTCEQSALPRSTTSKHIQHSRGLNPQSLTWKSRTVPRSHNSNRVIDLCLVGITKLGRLQFPFQDEAVASTT